MRRIEFDVDLLTTQYYALRSCAEVSKIYGCNPETIRRALVREGVALAGWKKKKQEPIRTRTPLDEAERQRIIDEFSRCGSFTETQKATNRGYETVKRVLYESGADIRPHGQKITDDEILADIAEGLTRQEIADRHGVHVENLARRMSRLGVHAKHASPAIVGKPFKKSLLSDVWHWYDGGKPYIEKYCGDKFEFVEYKQKRYRIRCKTCGSIIERERSCIRHYNTTCEVCAEREKQYKELQE